MNGHLSEDMLIKHAFDLLEEGQRASAGAHLEECWQCRGELERIRGKFAALDVLAGDPGVPEALVGRVLAENGSKRERKVRFWLPPVWMGVAAGVLVVASVLVLQQFREPAGGVKEAVSSLGEPGAAARPKAGGEQMGLALARHGTGGPAEAVYMADALAEDAAIDERPPFAPASAIELVVLPRRENVQLTIYNSADLTLVRERRNLTMKKGWNWLQFMWANTLIDPTSLSLEPMADKDKIDVQQLVYPARLKEIGRWLIRSEVEGQVLFEITYFTSGLSWRAFYMGTLSADEGTMRLQGYVRVDNRSGEEYENAQTRVIVGQVHLLDQIAELARQAHPYGSPVLTDGYSDWARNGDADSDAGELPVPGMGMMGGFGGGGFAGGAIKAIEKEGLSEYFLYTIEGTETIPNEWGKRLPSFEAEDVPVENLYKYDEGRWGTETVRFLSFVNDAEHKLGETPLPDGSVQVYRQAGEDGSLAYTGGAAFKYIPVNEEAELNLGAARQVKVEPALMDYSTTRHQFDGKGNIDGWDEVRTWKVMVTNMREIPVEVEVFRDFETPYWDMEQSGQFDAFEKEDMDTVKFTVDVPARSKREFVYVLTTHQGTRRETAK